MGEVTPKEAQKIRDAETAENEATKQAIVKAPAAQPTALEAVREDSQAIVMRCIDEATSAIVAGIPLNADEWAARLAAALAQPAREPDGYVTEGDARRISKGEPTVPSVNVWSVADPGDLPIWLGTPAGTTETDDV